MRPFTFTVTVEVERDEGKFASRDEIAEQIQDAIEGANPDSIDGENGGVYSVTSWEIEAVAE